MRDANPDAMERASEGDRLWFEAHPERHHRVRPAIDGELPGMPDLSSGWQWIVVKLIAAGVRVRMGFTSDRIPLDTEERAQQLLQHVMQAARRGR